MKHLIFLLIILLYFTSCSSKTETQEINGMEYSVTSIDSSANVLVETDSFSGVVFSEHESPNRDVFTFSMLLRPKEKDTITPFTPSLDDIVIAERILRRCAEVDEIGADSLAIGEVNDLSTYRRQYFWGINEKGQKLIWINCFSKESEFDHKDWKKEIVEVQDGSDWYFNVVANISTEECYRFFRNSIGG
ncbi:hypothetical protein [Pontibacter actiniarum]|uniref:DUF695 domain-containing protein n=1 Tax=Pontibacter actiniarum TaxID=323450 RepID=A0A1X9YS42_9BACT|nr:hypothetical protein [Pontibacter actiniarum]ARS35673.1 hypothetical protein CA264_09595 [Pontibacter actiniarum]